MMTNACKDYLNFWRYALNTTEEAKRSEYWFPTLAHIAFFTVLMLTDKENFEIEPGEQFIPTPLNRIYMTFALLTFIPTYTMFQRRLNHLGISKSIAHVIYAFNSLGYMWVLALNKMSQREIEDYVGRKNFMILASLVGVFYTVELTLAARKGRN